MYALTGQITKPQEENAMQRIVLCCAAGMSTSMLVRKMNAEAQQRALALDIYADAV